MRGLNECVPVRHEKSFKEIKTDSEKSQKMIRSAHPLMCDCCINGVSFRRWRRIYGDTFNKGGGRMCAKIQVPT